MKSIVIAARCTTFSSDLISHWSRKTRRNSPAYLCMPYDKWDIVYGTSEINVEHANDSEYMCFPVIVWSPTLLCGISTDKCVLRLSYSQTWYITLMKQVFIIWSLEAAGSTTVASDHQFVSWTPMISRWVNDIANSRSGGICSWFIASLEDNYLSLSAWCQSRDIRRAHRIK